MLHVENETYENGIPRNPTVEKYIPNLLFRLEFGYNMDEDDPNLRTSLMIPTDHLKYLPELPQVIQKELYVFCNSIEKYLLDRLNTLELGEEGSQ